jgi:hypothetical protein
MHTPIDRTTFLRRSLQLDGIASGLCGALLLLAAGPISTLIGLPGPAIARMVGVGLLVYAAALLWNAARAAVSRGEALLAVVLNIGWIVGSAIVVVDGPLTVVGNLAVAAVAGAVALFTLLEVVGLRRLRESAA